MQFRKEIIHSVTSLERWHLSGRIVEAYPFSQALLKQGGYGHHDVGFWVERPKRRGFSVIVITLSGRGRFTLEDGTVFEVGEGEIFVSSPNGQGHREETVGPEPWEQLWLTFYASSSILASEEFDWKVYRMQEVSLYRELASCILREDLHCTSDSSETIELAERLLLQLLRRLFSSGESEEKARVRSRMESLWNEISGSLDQEWNVSRLCSAMNCSRAQLTRICHEIYGVSPGWKIREMRMERAKQMLSSSSSSIVDIAESVGYSSPTLFSSSFSAYAGESPREYRKKRQQRAIRYGSASYQGQPSDDRTPR